VYLTKSLSLCTRLKHLYSVPTKIFILCTRLRHLLVKKFLKPAAQQGGGGGPANDEGCSATPTGRGGSTVTGAAEVKDASDDDEEGESGNESDATDARNNDSDEVWC
jgi:hypothetical protein